MQPRILSATRYHVECEVHTDYPLRFSASKGRRVECLVGVLWITAYGEAGDIFLSAGESFVLPNGGLALIEGVGCAKLRVMASSSALSGSFKLFMHAMQRLSKYRKMRTRVFQQ